MRLEEVDDGQTRACERERDTLRIRARPDADETACYVADLSQQLARMARNAKLDLPAYLLEMACLEARRSLDDDERCS